MCQIKEIVGDGICRFCPPAERVPCPEVPFSPAAKQTLGKEQLIRFRQRLSQARGYPTATEPAADDFRPTETAAEAALAAQPPIRTALPR